MLCHEFSTLPLHCPLYREMKRGAMTVLELKRTEPLGHRGLGSFLDLSCSCSFLAGARRVHSELPGHGSRRMCIFGQDNWPGGAASPFPSGVRPKRAWSTAVWVRRPAGRARILGVGPCQVFPDRCREQHHRKNEALLAGAAPRGPRVPVTLEKKQQGQANSAAATASLLDRIRPMPCGPGY